MDSIILIFVCMLAGVGLQRVKAFPPNAYVALNQFVIYISLPGLALYYIPKIEASIKLLYPLGVAWVGFLLAFIFFVVLGKIFGWSRKLTGCLILTGGLGNTSFVGFPVIEALYGKEGLETAIIVDQPGTFVVMATLGIIVAAAYSKGATGTAAMAKKILFFPPFIAFFLGVCMNTFNYDFITDVQSVLLRLGNTVTPVALVAVGMQLKIDVKSKHWSFLALGLFFKLILMPAFFFVLYKVFLKGQGIETEVSIMEAAMAPMITASILASSHGLKPRLSGMMVGVGIPLSFITLALWYWLLYNY
ncbi:AEC family transporter [Flavobacterium arcticum]|uniref:AEC family transporter n=1 Tax=Flavobacterium arcticum TaxID=1784713 RepID=A0A345H845_9FLAO|nr:AEC family transporter [Flavobacterium arcticum]AXG72755.1 AEC family transporter [Flavobacterium arcticum]KAF2510975.1 AEC family transporter [Flavobacterium arcticum]